jgi:hypothetical protein
MKPGFRQYLNATRNHAMNTLLHKAYVANRLAKVCRGSQRSRLYDLKCRHLSQAIELSRDEAVCDSVASSPTRIIGITTRQGYRFHVPFERLSELARAHFDNSWEVRSFGAAA